MLIYNIPVDISCDKFKQILKCEEADPIESVIILIKQRYATFL